MKKIHFNPIKMVMLQAALPPVFFAIVIFIIFKQPIPIYAYIFLSLVGSLFFGIVGYIMAFFAFSLVYDNESITSGFPFIGIKINLTNAKLGISSNPIFFITVKDNSTGNKLYLIKPFWSNDSACIKEIIRKIEESNTH